MKNINKRKSIGKYSFGDFVTRNQQSINTGTSGLASLGAMTGDEVATGVTSGLASGAALGTALMPGIGTAIGGLGGALLGGLAGNKRVKAERKRKQRVDDLKAGEVMDMYESNLDTYNEDYYGTYAEGGTVNPGRRNRKLIAGARKDKMVTEAKDVFDEILDAPQKIATMAVTGNYEKPSKALKRNGYITYPATEALADITLDPLNMINAPASIGRKGIKYYNNSQKAVKYLLKGVQSYDNFGEISEKFENGGDVDKEIINIEKGELEIDADTGKIKREFTGINPETGGKYESHSKKGEDTFNNLVTADLGSFIITTKEGKRYKDALKNNDKLLQNSIKSNIRNKKQSLTNKFADGGDIYPGFYNDRLKMLDPTRFMNIPDQLTPTKNVNINTQASIAAPTAITNEVAKPKESSFDKRLSKAMGSFAGLSNIVGGLQAPDYMKPESVGMNVGLRQKTLASLPDNVSVNPALNNINNAIYSEDNNIRNSTSNSSISRALRANNFSAGRSAINDAYLNNNNINNSLGMQRAGVYSNLAAQDEARAAQNVSLRMNADSQNRQMSLAKRQQTNTGISQLIENYQNNKTNEQLSKQDQFRLQLLKDMNPYIKNYTKNWEPYLNN